MIKLYSQEKEKYHRGMGGIVILCFYSSQHTGIPECILQ